MYYDSGEEDPDRILMFATEDTFIHMSFNKIWICDGAFAVAPRNFEQLFTFKYE
jgi:hypothetical protein